MPHTHKWCTMVTERHWKKAAHSHVCECGAACFQLRSWISSHGVRFLLGTCRSASASVDSPKPTRTDRRSGASTPPPESAGNWDVSTSPTTRREGSGAAAGGCARDSALLFEGAPLVLRGFVPRRSHTSWRLLHRPVVAGQVLLNDHLPCGGTSGRLKREGHVCTIPVSVSGVGMKGSLNPTILAHDSRGHSVWGGRRFGLFAYRPTFLMNDGFGVTPPPREVQDRRAVGRTPRVTRVSAILSCAASENSLRDP